MDLANHKERVHEYGENYEIYPCEDCGYRGDDIVSIRTHIDTNHKNFVIGSDSLDSLEDLGIKKLPEITKRRKQDLRDLVMDENGDLVLDGDKILFRGMNYI